MGVFTKPKSTTNVFTKPKSTTKVFTKPKSTTKYNVGQQVELTTYWGTKLPVTITKVLTKSNRKPWYKVRYNHDGIECAGIYDSRRINVSTTVGQAVKLTTS